MLLKEQALKRLHSQFQQKKAHRHRRTKSLGDDDSEVIEGNDKIATETKDKNADKESSATREASSTALKGDPPPQQRYKLWERELLSSYARLKQHYASKLQPSDANAAAPPETNGSAAVAHEGGNSPEWHRLLSEDGEVFSTPKLEGIVSKKGLKTKFAPFYFEVHTGCILYDRMHFKGSLPLRISEGAVEVKHALGPLPRVLFEQTEGYIFWVQNREDASCSLSPTNRRDPPLLSLASSSKDDMMEWVRAMCGSPKGKRKKKKDKLKNTDANPDIRTEMISDESKETKDCPPSWKKEGWLWVKTSRPGDVWSSYYCLANEYSFEWFKRDVKQMLSLENVSEIKTKVLLKTDKTRKQATTFAHSVHLQPLNEYSYKITLGVAAKIPYKEKLMGKFKFLVGTEERMNTWVSVLRAQTGKTPHIGKKQFENPLGESKTFRSTVAMRAPKGTPTKIQTALTTPEIGKAWLQNYLRDVSERGDAEMGKTPLGNYKVDAPMPKDGKYRIITFDGGGLRSVVSIIILERLVEVFPDLLERINLFSGTSGGSILAACLAMGRSPTWIKTVMLKFSKFIFTRKARQFVTTARYDNNILRLMGEELFGGTTLKDAPRSLLITAFQLDNGRVGEDFHSWIPRIFHNLPAAHPRPDSHFPKKKTNAAIAEKTGSERASNGSTILADGDTRAEAAAAGGDESLGANKEEEESHGGFPVPAWPSEEDLSFTLTDLLLASSAAPTYFPAHKGFVDGGLFAHNPCMVAVASVMSQEHAHPLKPSQLEVLSIGTGCISQYVEGEDLDWGIMQWARKLPDMIFGASVSNAALLCRLQLGKNFYRLDPALEKPIPMDDPSMLDDLVNVAIHADLEDTIDWIREHFYGVVAKKQKKRKPKPRLKTRSQWWGQPQLFGEMFSSDDDAINQNSKKKNEKSVRGWIKSKLSKSDQFEGLDEEEGYEEYIKHTITETEDEFPKSDELEYQNSTLSQEDIRGGEGWIRIKEEIDTTKERGYSDEEFRKPEEKDHDEEKGVLCCSASGIHVMHPRSSTCSVDDAQEEEEEDLKTELDDLSDSEADPQCRDKRSRKGSAVEEGCGWEIIEQESEAAIEEDVLIEIEQEIGILENEIARLVALKRERERRMEATLRRRERGRMLKIKREGEGSENLRRRSPHKPQRHMPHQQPQKVDTQNKDKNDMQPQRESSEAAFAPHEWEVTHEITTKSAHCVSDEYEPQEEAEETKLMEVITNFLRRDKKDKDQFGSLKARKSDQSKEKRKTDQTRKKIFQSFSPTSLSSHLSSLPFHSSTEKQQQNHTDSEPRKNPSSLSKSNPSHSTPILPFPMKRDKLGSIEKDDCQNDATDCSLHAGEDDREKEKKGHFANFINKRILDMQKSRRKRVSSLPINRTQEEGEEEEEVAEENEETKTV